MRSKKYQKNFLMSVLLIFTVFLYGCGGSAGVQESTMSFELLDVTTKAPVEDVQVILQSVDPNPGDGNAYYINRQLSTDSRGKVTFADLSPDRQYPLLLFESSVSNHQGVAQGPVQETSAAAEQKKYQ
jgi:hypothetical protein